MMKIISAFGTSKLSGHIISDDVFYFEYLLNKGYKFEFFAASYSYFNLKKIFLDTSNLFRLGQRNYDFKKSDTVIFLGYTEKQLANIIFQNFFKCLKITLISTNNISKGRFRKKRFILFLFYKLMNPWIKKLIVHSEFEQKLIVKNLPFLKNKVGIKRHHLFVSKTDDAEQAINKKIKISFFGPVKPEKPIEPFCNLIKCDKEKKFDFQIINVRDEDLKLLKKLTNLPSNLNYVSGWVDEEEYTELVKSSDLIFLSHQLTFEGKTSGNLTDSISYRKPFISQYMAPMCDLCAEVGPIGFFVNFNEENWASEFLASFSMSSYTSMKKNITELTKIYSIDNVFYDLEIVFGKAG